MWADSLKTEEVEGTLAAADQLSAATWAVPLLQRTKPILDRLRVGMTDKKAYQANPLQPSEMSLLFEIRFARALTDAGLSAQYEHSAGVGNSTVDFLVDGDPPWLFELVSLHESNAFKAASWKSGVWAGFQMGTNADDLRQSEEGETLKAQERIGAKVFDGQQPIKFPEPNGSIHMIMVDARGFLGDGHGDKADWSQIAYGSHGMELDQIRYWTNPNTHECAPIMGLFEPGCPQRAAPTLQSRVHCIGFVCESTFAADEIKQRVFNCCNPALFADEDGAGATMARWPLRRNAARYR